MEPEIAKKLMSDVPEMQDFVAYVVGEVRKLDTVQGLGNITSPVDKAVEITGRERAIEILANILKPLINLQDFEGNDKKDFAVDVE